MLLTLERNLVPLTVFVNCLYRRLTLLVVCICATVTARPDVSMVERDAHSTVTESEQLPPELQALLAEQPKWTASATIDTAIGQNDNVLLSAGKDARRSDFTRLGLEALMWHVPQNRIDYFAFLNADLTRFFTEKAIRYEGQAFTGLEWRYRVDDVFSFALDGQGYYLDQIFDISDTEVQQVVAELKVAGAKVGPTVRWSPLSWAWVEASAKGARENLKEIVVASRAETSDHTTLTEPRFRVGVRPVKDIEVSVEATERRRHYATHPRYTRGGQIDNGVLAIRERELEGQIDSTWGRARHWKTTTRLNLLQYADNGVGYLNYFQRGAAQDVDWSAGNWTVHAEGEVKHKQYELQEENQKDVILGTSTRPLIKEEFSAGLRVERKISAAWSLYAAYNWERTRSNDFVVPYRVKEGLLGARWNWEK